MVKNYMEIVVEHLLPLVLEEYKDICICEKCIDDIKAIALNNLKPLYVVSERGELYTKVNELKIQFKIDTITAITEAINIVTKNPKHQVI